MWEDGTNIPPQTLPLTPKPMMLNRFILLRCKPPYPPFSLCIFRPYTLAPSEVIIDLDEVVVSEDGGLGLDSPEEVGHWFFEFGLETWVGVSEQRFGGRGVGGWRWR